MANQNVEKQRVEKAIEVAAYLEKEIEALKYVIEEVPYNATPPEGYSIIELLLLIDHTQRHYYEPVFSHLLHDTRPTRLNNFNQYKNTFNPEEPENKDIQEVLSRLANHRASFINDLNNITISYWSKVIYNNNKEILLIDFIEEMNHTDQIHLKKITSLVKSYHDEKASQRELKLRQQKHKPGN